MRYRWRGFFVISMYSVVTFAGRAGEAGSDEDEPMAVDGAELTKMLRLPAFGTTRFTVTARSAVDATLTVDCRPPADPDDVGPVFRLSAPSLGLSEPPRAGFTSLTRSVPAGAHTLTFQNLGPATSCTVRTTPVPASATCRAWSSFHSVNTNHTHVRVGTDASSDWEAFPVSGNHWGAWAKWNIVYDQPVKRGFLLHNLEHGGLVLSYKCSSASQSAACRDARDQLVALVGSSGLRRVIVTPDPTQPERFAIRGWRWGYSADCFDEASARAFATAHIRHGREDTDADPPIPYDPTTTAVPCQDLMSAPDSCPE